MSTPVNLDPVRGMRDFYPEDMRLRNRVFDAWRAAALAAGFENYDACVVESLETLERKAGEEIVRQIYSFEDKSGRRLALRPEVTPSLARMIVARQNAISLPVKWFTVAQCFRYERMTRGRKREHYQLNCDIVGAPEVFAEAELLAVAVDALRRMGVPDEAYRVRLSSRALLSELLLRLDVPADRHATVFLGLDKLGKMPNEEIRRLLLDEGLSEADCDKAFRLLDIRSLDDARAIAGEDSPAIAQIDELFRLLDLYGIRSQVVFDIAVVRGLSYYTGVVFEAFDTQGKFRAIFGGGRYDGLLQTMGGKPATAVGFGFGDVVVGELLKDLFGDKAATPARKGVMVGYMDAADRDAATRLAVRLRADGEDVCLALQPQKPKKFFAAAGDSTYLEAALVGSDDRASGTVRLKNLDTQVQRSIPLPS